MAGDPNPAAAGEILAALPAAGADIIELGFPFSDPMADGPSIQAAGERALAGGASLRTALAALKAFRACDGTTPVVLMGYANPIAAMGEDAFAAAAHEAGADGVIVVDLPPEEDGPLREALSKKDIALVRLATPTTDEARLKVVLEGVSGFVYYVSVTGVTGSASPVAGAAKTAVQRLKRATDLPVAVGFGVRTPEMAAAIAREADAVVVGSRLVDDVASCVARGAPHEAAEAVASTVRDLSLAVRGARTAQEGIER
jgi:tryptophan synthase alpha chain